MNFPFKHVAGDTLDFGPISVPDFPSTDGWTLSYFLTPRFTTPTQGQITVVAVSNADGTYQLQASPTTTAAWKAGAYGWERRVDKSGARQTLASSEDQGEVLVLAKAEDRAQGYDSRSFARKRLEQLETALLAFTDPTVKSYAIGTRTITREDLPNIITERDRALWEVANEDAAAKIAAGQSNPRHVGVSFSRV